MRVNLTTQDSILTLRLQGKASAPLSLAAPVVSLLSGLQGELLPHLLPAPPPPPAGCTVPREKPPGLYYQHLPKTTHKTNTSLPPGDVQFRTISKIYMTDTIKFTLALGSFA